MKLKIELQEVFSQFMLGNVPLIYYSSNTVWWTHDPNDLRITEQGLPVDAFGSPLYQTENVKDFLNQRTIESFEGYGKEGNRSKNFMLSHAKNIHLATNKMPHSSFALVKGRAFFDWADENFSIVTNTGNELPN